MAVAEDILKDPYFANLDIDLSQFSDEEKTAILGVMQKAKVLDQQRVEDKFRQPTEGQLSKWTNLMKGWQFRWFTLDPDSGLLEYYVDKEKKKLGPRGSVYLGGSMIAPSDEDSFTFAVSAANGDIFKLRANDAKERQDWINKLRSVAEFHTSSIAEAAPPLYTTHSFSLSSAQSSGPVKQTVTAASSSGHPQVAGADELSSDSPKVTHETYHVPEKIMEQISHIREDLYRIEDQQMVLIDLLELDSTGEESLFPLDNDVLILKATAQSALSTLHHCFSILQGQAADVQSEASGDALQRDENTSDFKSHGDKTSGEGRSFGFHKNPGTPKSQRKDSKTTEITADSSGVSCCEKARAEMKYNVARRVEEETDDEAYCTAEESENQSVEEHKSVILHLVSQLKLGMDLTKVVLPTFILEPRSLLEMYADFFAHPDLFVKIPDGLTAEDRILSVVEFYLTSFHAGRKGSLAKKPYNPILGETFHCSWKVPMSSNAKQPSTNSHIDHSSTVSDDGRVSFVAEQLSHHPPISGFYAECPSKQLCFNAHIWTKSKFYGMSIGVVNQGVGVISLLEHNEDYVITFPSTYCRSILTFPWVELGGKVNITCAKTGYNASVTFHTKPFYGGKLHRVTGEVKNTSSGKVICKVNGEWNGQIELNFTSHQEEPKVINTEALQVCRKRVCPQSKQDEFESRRLWHRVTHALKSDDIDSATSAKHELEERQRKEARERKETGVEWKTKLFHRHGDGWMYNHHMKTLVKSSLEEATSTTTQPTEQ